jgi:hypothetical protein
MIPDRFWNYELTYLEKIKHQIRKSSNHKLGGYGIKAISSDNEPNHSSGGRKAGDKKSPEVRHTN